MYRKSQHRRGACRVGLHAPINYNRCVWSSLLLLSSSLPLLVFQPLLVLVPVPVLVPGLLMCVTCLPLSMPGPGAKRGA